MIVSVLAFGIKRLIEMVQYTNPDVKVTTLEDFYETDYTYADREQL